MVRVIAISDVHGNWRGLKDILTSEEYDAVFIAGDLSDYSGMAGKVVETLVKYVKNVAYVVIGNMDNPKLLNELKRYEVLRVLHGDVTHYLDYLVVGFSGGLISPFNTLFELDDVEFSKLITDVNASLPSQGSLIILSHTPPYNTKVDLTHMGLHVGSKALRDFIEFRKPIITICGHIHEGRGYDYVGSSLIVNPGPLLRGYYATIELKNVISFELKSLSSK